MRINPEFPEYHHNDPKREAELRVYQEIEATQISGQALYEVKAARHSPEVDFVVWVEDVACFTLQENALVADYRANANSHTAHLMDFTAGRIATASDIPTNRKLDTPLLKRISGTEYLATRDVGMRAEAERVATATLFIAMNPGSLEVMDLTDSGLFERIRILPYPELPPDRPKDRDLAMNVISEPAIRQAMLALLVRYAVANRCGHRTIFQAWPRLARWQE